MTTDAPPGSLDMDAEWVAVFNACECGFWIAMAVAVLILRRSATAAQRPILALAALALLLFGASDWIETGTGAWWDPPWLLLWKALCLGTLLECGRRWQRVEEVLKRGF